MLYVLNSATLPLKERGRYLIKARELTVKEASEMLKSEPFISAVGHESTAKALSNVFGVTIPYNRTQITLQPGDKLISIILKKRLPEGIVLKTVEELEQIGYSIWLFEVEPDPVQEIKTFLKVNPGII
jgi:c-di-GMP-related signal transduction protein